MLAHTNNIVSQTSSRLDRIAVLPSFIEGLEEVIIQDSLEYINKKLDCSKFFNLLQKGKLRAEVFQYAFLQYRFWRDQLHRWFALCIIKASSCSKPDQKQAIMAMADHIFTDLRDDHDVMYISFLHDLGLSDERIEESKKSAATLKYENSFFNDFGYSFDNFNEAMLALSGRELCVSLRNCRILEYYCKPLDISPLWLTLHADLEVEHFRDAIRPVLINNDHNSLIVEQLTRSIRLGIDRHFQYFDEMLDEFNCKSRAI